MQYDRHLKNIYSLDIKTIDQKSHKKIYYNFKIEERQILDLDLGNTPEKIRGDCLDMYEGLQSEVISTIRFDENSDLNTYSSKIDITSISKFKAEEKFSISEQGYMIGKLLDGTVCQILLGTGASKSFMSKSNYLWCKPLHLLPKFASKTHRIEVGNGHFVSVLFIIPIVSVIHGYRFKIFTLVSDIHENVDLVFGIKNIFKLEGIINSWEACFSFLNRSIPFFP